MQWIYLLPRASAVKPSLSILTYTMEGQQRKNWDFMVFSLIEVGFSSLNLSFNRIRLISKIGRREPLSFSVWKLLVRVVFKNGAFWVQLWITIQFNTIFNPNDTLVETLSLVKLSTIAVNLFIATCISCQTFAFYTNLHNGRSTAEKLRFHGFLSDWSGFQ